MSGGAETLKLAIAQDCLGEILSIASGRQIRPDAAAVIASDACPDRAALLTALRAIKAQAIEAEVLLRSIDDNFAGVAQPDRAPGASHSEVASSNLAPRSTSSDRGDL